MSFHRSFSSFLFSLSLYIYSSIISNASQFHLKRLNFSFIFVAPLHIDYTHMWKADAFESLERMYSIDGWFSLLACSISSSLFISSSWLSSCVCVCVWCERESFVGLRFVCVWCPSFDSIRQYWQWNDESGGKKGWHISSVCQSTKLSERIHSHNIIPVYYKMPDQLISTSLNLITWYNQRFWERLLVFHSLSLPCTIYLPICYPHIWLRCNSAGKNTPAPKWYRRLMRCVRTELNRWIVHGLFFGLLFAVLWVWEGENHSFNFLIFSHMKWISPSATT